MALNLKSNPKSKQHLFAVLSVHLPNPARKRAIKMYPKTVLTSTAVFVSGRQTSLAMRHKAISESQCNAMLSVSSSDPRPVRLLWLQFPQSTPTLNMHHSGSCYLKLKHFSLFSKANVDIACRPIRQPSYCQSASTSTPRYIEA